MTAHNTDSRVHGPCIGDPALRSAPPPRAVRSASGGSRRPYTITKLGCLSTYDYLCHDHACDLWPVCQHGGNRD